jgi:hypothetical protein
MVKGKLIFKYSCTSAHEFIMWYLNWNFLLIYKEPKGKKYLAPRVNTVQLVAVGGVPEANTSISCSTSRCKKATLVG